jgi:hypothetical protein
MAAADKPVMMLSGPGTTLEPPCATREEQLVREYLARALDASTPPLAGTQLIRRFFIETPDLFCRIGLTLVNAEADSPAQEYMASLLLKQQAALRHLTNPRLFSKPQSISLFRYLMKFEQSLDILLAGCLSGRSRTMSSYLPVTSGERALDILDATSTGRRILPILGRLVDYPDPRLSCKAVLLMGKRLQSVDWVKKFLDPAQVPRVRANVIESIWGLDTEDARNLLAEHTSDSNNRVAGNAVLGLHILGERQAIPAVVELSNMPQPEFRVTSAWAMNRMGCPDFTPHLKALVKDQDSRVRNAALRALVNIRRESSTVSVPEQASEGGDASNTH